MSEEIEKRKEIDDIENDEPEVETKKHPTGKLAILIGLIAVLICWVPIISVVFAVIAIILAKRARKFNEDKTFGNLALVSSIFAIVINAIITIGAGVAIYVSLNMFNGLKNTEMDTESREKIMDFFERLDITLDNINL